MPRCSAAAFSPSCRCCAACVQGLVHGSAALLPCTSVSYVSQCNCGVEQGCRGQQLLNGSLPAPAAPRSPAGATHNASSKVQMALSKGVAVLPDLHISGADKES